MSLINDALKRAKEADRQAPVPPRDLPFRPVEPAQQGARRGLGLLLPVLLALVALLVLFLGWQWVQRPPAPKAVEAAARTAPTAERVAGTPSSASTPVEASTARPGNVGQSQASAPGTATTPATEASAGAAEPPVAQEIAATNAVPAVVPEPPKPAPLRLQAILFHPQRPSAIVSGKTVFVGDKVAEFRVTAIEQDNVVLTGGGLSQTNVLSLPQ